MWTGRVTKGAVDRLAFSPDGRTLYTRDSSVVRAWDTATQQATTLMTRAGSYPTNGDLVPGERVLFVAHRDHITAIPTDGPLVAHRVPHIILSACLIDGGRTLLTADTDVTLRGWAVPEFAAVVPPAFPPGAYVYSRITATPDGTRTAGLVRVGIDYALTVWDVPANRPVLELRRATMMGLAYPVVSPDGTAVACGETTHLVVLDLPGGDVRFDARPGRMDVIHTAWHPGGRLLAAAGETPVVYFLDAQTGKTLARYDWKVGKVRSLAFSPDGTVCAAGGSSKAVAVWDVDY